MDTNKIIRNIHKAAVAKIAEGCSVEGNAKKAVEIGNAIIEYGKAWTNAFADDGKIADIERGRIAATFSNIIDHYVPSIDNKAIEIAWNGIDNWLLKLFGVTFKGVRYYLNEWFHLGL